MTAGAVGLATGAQTSSDRAGWVAGAGVSYLWTPNVALNVEYQYVDLGGINLASSTGAALPQLTQSASASGRFQVVTVGLSWLFAPAGGTRAPWQGGYVGGHAGGAWGDTTTASYSGSGTFVSDTRLKRDVVLLTRLDNGLGLYRYRYLWSDTVYVGVIAQEVALIHPDAVVQESPGRLSPGRLRAAWPQTADAAGMGCGQSGKNVVADLLRQILSASGPSRHFTATQLFSCFRRSAPL